MTVIEASFVRAQTMADSTLRLTVDVEPQFANDAFQLFGKVGTPLALAALKVKRHDEPEEKPERANEREPLGPICWWAVQRCREEKFRSWLGTMSLNGDDIDEERAKQIICRLCDIETRKDLDLTPAAGAKFRKTVLEPYRKWLQAQEETNS